MGEQKKRVQIKSIFPAHAELFVLGHLLRSALFREKF